MADIVGYKSNDGKQLGAQLTEPKKYVGQGENMETRPILLPQIGKGEIELVGFENVHSKEQLTPEQKTAISNAVTRGLVNQMNKQVAAARDQQDADAARSNYYTLQLPKFTCSIQDINFVEKESKGSTSQVAEYTFSCETGK